jgi:predicted secreted Zn-dependent protease
MLRELRLEYGIRYASSLMEMEKSIRTDWAAKNKINFQQSSPEDAQKIFKAANTANDIFFKKQEAAGAKNVRAVYDYYLKARQRYEEQHKKNGHFN